MVGAMHGGLFWLVRVGVWATALVAGAAGRAAEPVVWRLEAPDRIGGGVTQVWGEPKAAERGMVFDGARDGLLVEANPLAGWKAFTVELLFCPAEGGSEAQRFFHAEDSGGMRALVEIRVNGRGGWWLDTFLRTERDQRTLIDPQRVHPTGRWHWVALRYDGAEMAHFVNGEQELAGPVAFGPMGSGRVSLGVRQNRVYWFKGAIREVRFTPEALPAERLQRVK